MEKVPNKASLTKEERKLRSAAHCPRNNGKVICLEGMMSAKVLFFHAPTEDLFFRTAEVLSKGCGLSFSAMDFHDDQLL